MFTKKIDAMLMATFLTTLFYSSTYPYIHQIIMTYANSRIIALNQIINCISVIIFSSLWNKLGEKLFRFYPIFCVAETLVGIATTMFTIITQKIMIYYILDTLVFAFITRNIICGGIKLRALRYITPDLREKFDNNNNSIASLATILGSIIALFLKLNFNIMLCIATLGNIIDNIFYIIIFLNEKNKKIFKKWKKVEIK